MFSLHVIRTLLLAPFAAIRLRLLAARARRRWKESPAGGHHVLLVSWDFPPMDPTGAHVPSSFARHAVLCGWDVTVICGPCPEEPTAAGLELAESIPPAVQVHHAAQLPVKGFFAHPLIKKALPAVDGGYLTAVAMTETALRCLTQPPSVVIASGPRFSNFLAARWLSQVLGVKLVLQYRDEWTVNTPAFVQNSAEDQWQEQRCLKRADLVTFVSDGKHALYRRSFPHLDTAKLITVPNGWEPFFHERLASATRHLAAAKGRFTLTYTGRWHASLVPLLDALERLFTLHPIWAERLCVVFLGNQLAGNADLMRAFSERHPGALLALPPVPARTALEIQRESSALLLINDHKYDGVVPLKTYDYLCASRPILVFGRQGGAAKIIEDVGAGLVTAVGDAIGLGRALDEFTEGPAERWNTPERKAWAMRHNRAVLVPQILRRMEGLTVQAYSEI